MNPRDNLAVHALHEPLSDHPTSSGFGFRPEDRMSYVHTEELKDFIFEGGVLPPALRKELLFALEHSDVARVPVVSYPSTPPDEHRVRGSGAEARAVFHAKVLLRLLWAGHPLPAQTRKYLIDSLRRMERSEMRKELAAGKESRLLHGQEVVHVDWSAVPKGVFLGDVATPIPLTRPRNR
jgi:hypothetical protein